MNYNQPHFVQLISLVNMCANSYMWNKLHLCSRVCWRLRIDGFVSNEWRRRRFLLVEDIAAAAATPIGP